MNTNQKLDFLLSNLNIETYTPQTMTARIPDWQYIRSIITNMDEETELLYKLAQDGYVRKEHNSIITIEGRLFIERGGYVAKQKRETVTLYFKRVQTWSIVVGTALAGAYALYQLIQALIH